jgi:hypothetical protein
MKSLAGANESLPTRWIKGTNDWTTNFAKEHRIIVKDTNSIEEFLPKKVGGKLSLLYLSFMLIFCRFFPVS